MRTFAAGPLLGLLGLGGSVLCLSACVSFGLQVQPAPPPSTDPPLPPSLEGEAPTLRATEFEGIQLAENHNGLYYAEQERLWYRHWRGQWFQAFSWDGHWFPPESVPRPLRAGPVPPLRSKGNQTPR